MTADADALKTLLRIQDLDHNLDGLRHQRISLPEFEALAANEAELGGLATTTAEVEVERHEIERTQKRHEDDVSLLEDRIAEENTKLYGGNVTGVKDLQALQDEIAGLKNRQTQVEDQILEVMELAEPVDARLAELARTSTALDQAGDEIRATIATRESEIDAELATTAVDRTESAAAVDAAVLTDYERLRSRPGSVGVAKLIGSTCHGCHLELPAVEVDRLRKLPDNELVHCEECGCILVRT
jgi:predicted  nucleic acid-binding Zn-ribbon protein